MKADIKDHTQNQWATILPRLGVESFLLNGKHHPSPVAGGKNGFRFIDKVGDGYFVNNNVFGDGFELLHLLYGWDFKTSCKEIRQALGIDGENYTPPTQAEKKERKVQQAIEVEKRAQALAIQHAEVAESAMRVWQAATPEVGHAYLSKKSVVSYGLRMDGRGNLILAVRISGAISSIRYINQHGGKFFMSFGEVAGGCYFIKGDDAALNDCFIIVEGYATGASIREAAGHHVLVAFNASNLIKVSVAVRKKYPGATIIIGADNDLKTFKSGEDKGKSKPNVGLLAAIEAAKAVAGLIALPCGKQGDSTDWNDIHASKGLEIVAAGIANALPLESFEQLLPPKEENPTKKGINKMENRNSKSLKLNEIDNHKKSKCIDKKSNDYNDLTIPADYLCNESGVFVDYEDKELERITHRAVWVAALSRDCSCDNWGRLVCWVDHDGKQHERALPAAIFHANGNELAQELATAGLPIVPSKERRLLQYLAAFTPEMRLTAATATGWHGKAFVMPSRTLNEPTGERIIYQSSEYRDTGWMRKAGSLKTWQGMVEDVSPLVKFAIAASLSSPVRHLAHIAAGGFHFFGRTSHSKTTLLQAAASVWGNATDPAMSGGEDAYIQRWNATKNGLEGMAACFNDLALIIDEVGESDGRDFGRIVYQLMSGTGKTRANRNGGISKRRTWRILLLSSGELPVSEFIEGAKGGQLVRLIDIAAADIFNDAKEADDMKLGCSVNYGQAGVALLESGNLLSGWGEFDAECIGEAPTPEAGRVRDRFKLVAYVGELAISRNILTWAKGSILDACKHIFNDWKEGSSASSDAERGIENIRAFLLAYGGSRFEYDDDRKRDPIDRAGAYRNERYNFTPKAFKEACNGVLEKTVKKALYDADFLHVDEVGKYVNKAKVGGVRTRVICVKADILTDPVKTTWATGATGAKPYTVTPKPCPPQGGQQGRTWAESPTCPPCPPPISQGGQAETVATKGRAHNAHHAHHKNTKLEKKYKSSRGSQDDEHHIENQNKENKAQKMEEKQTRKQVQNIGSLGRDGKIILAPQNDDLPPPKNHHGRNGEKLVTVTL